MIRPLDDKTLIAGQISPQEVSELGRHGVTMIVNNRPDGEDDGQPLAADIEAAAEQAGIAYRHVPIRRGSGLPTWMRCGKPFANAATASCSLSVVAGIALRSPGRWPAPNKARRVTNWSAVRQARNRFRASRAFALVVGEDSPRCLDEHHHQGFTSPAASSSARGASQNRVAMRETAEASDHVMMLLRETEQIIVAHRRE